MQIKVFKAGTMKEAMAAMKAELGDDAVILHSKKYKEGGVLGIGSKEVVEITAAVEESAMPEREIAPKPAPPRPTLFSNAANRYKTSGTPQGIAQAAKEVENLSKPAPRPTLINSEVAPRTLQTDSLTAKVAAQNKIPAPVEEVPTSGSETKFEEILQESIAPEPPAEVESQSDAEILNSIEETEEEIPPQQQEEISAEESPQEIEETKLDEQYFSKEEPETVEQPAEVEEVAKVEEAPAVEENKSVEDVSSEEKPAEISAENTPETEESKTESETVEQPAEVEEAAKVEETPAVEENKSVEEVSSEEKPAETSADTTEPENSQAEQVAEPKQEIPQQQEQAPPPPQSSVELTPEQLAQAQAMMFAQFNQMQMAQVMQQAVAQAQAQAQLQVAEMAEQMREVHRQRLGTGQAAPIETEPTEQDKIQRLEEEIAHMKALLAEVLGKESKKGGLSLHEALRRQEVDEEILTEMATQAGAGDTLVDSKSGVARITLSNYLTEHLRFADGIKLNRHGVRLVALLGTTGVGKTTTLAKIAAKFVLEHGVNAALITADTYRISAVEQLKTYSDILGLPLEIVYTPAELNAAIDKHKHKELILIDTAGRSQQNIHQMQELEEFLRVNPRIEKHLVISATTKLTDAKDIVNKFAAVTPEKIIVTKIDETASLGMIINLMHDKKLSLSYITTGQSVPDDIELATADILTDLVLKKVDI